MKHEDVMKALAQLVMAGLAEIATDYNGRTIYRNGKIVYRITEKGRKVAAILLREGGTDTDLIRIAKTVSNKPKLDGTDRHL
jgi:DNA-binding PadR family transcriptional regulator